MGKVVVFGHTKGGVGKSTLSLNTADAIASRGFKTVLIDADPMRGNTKLRQLFGDGIEHDFEVLDLSASKTLGKDIEKLAKDHQFVIVDCPPSKDSAAMAAACTTADVLLVPFNASPMDFIELIEMRNFLAESQKSNPKLKGASIANLVKTPPSTINLSIIDKAKTMQGVASLDGYVSNRVFFTDCQASAKGVSSSRAKTHSDTKAQNEIETMISSLLDLMK